MAFSFWKKMFGADGESTVCDVPVDNGSEDKRQGVCAASADVAVDSEESSSMNEGDIHGLEQFVEYVAKNLVDNTDAVTVSTVEKERIRVIQIRCEKKDIGKIIGKSGKTIAALRLLVSGAGGRVGQRVTVDVLD